MFGLVRVGSGGLPGWVRSRYELLWSVFGRRRFTRDEAFEVLKNEGLELSGEALNQLLSVLRRNGLVVVEADLFDARRKIYTLKAPPGFREFLTRGDLEGLMKRAADLIRTRVDYEFILICCF